MKKLYRALGVLLLVSVVSAAVILILSPDVIPAHYNAAGEVDRFGSKYETLIFPGLALIVTAALLLVQRHQANRQVPENEQKVLLVAAMGSVALFTALGLFFGVAGIRYASSPELMDPDLIVKFTVIGLGVVIIALGNMMPKVRRNSLFGLRTKWSTANDRVWQKSQRFGGFASVICGLMLIIFAAALSGIWHDVAVLAVFAVWIIACILASYHYWKTDDADGAP